VLKKEMVQVLIDYVPKKSLSMIVNTYFI